MNAKRFLVVRTTAFVVVLCGMLVPDLDWYSQSGITSLTAQEPGDGPIALDTVLVLGSRVSAELPVRTRSVEVLDRSTLDQFPAQTLADVLGWVAGIEVGQRSPAQADLSIRGAGFEQVLILLNGVRMTDPQTGHFNLNLTVPLERIERIEILRGPASALYGGDAVGGVVNVVTRDDAEWSGSVQGGSFGTRSASLHGGLDLGSGGARVRTGGEWVRSDGHRDGTDYRILQGGAEAEVPFATGWLQTEVGLGERSFGAHDFYAPFPSYEVTETATASLGWQSRAGESVRVEPRISWRRHEDDFILIRDQPEVYRNEHRSSQRNAEIVARGRLAGALTWAGGTEIGRDELRSTNLGDRHESRAALYVEGGHAGVGPIAASLGLRWDRHGTWGTFVSPSASASYDLGSQIRLRGSVGRAFRGATWTERYYTDPNHQANAELDPERSTSWEAGVDWLPGGTARVSLAVFQRTSRDLIDWSRPAGTSEADEPWETRNVNRAQFRGLELDGRWEVAPGTRLRLSGSMLSLTADAASGLESKYALRPLAEQVAVEARQALAPGTTLSARVLRARRVADSTFHQVDLRLAAPFMAGIVHLDLVNLGNSNHLDLVGHPVAERAIYLGYRWGGRP